MTPHYEAGPVRIFHGDCIDVMRELPDNSVDAVVTDPPYGLEFMGKEWDSFKVDRRQAHNGDLKVPDNQFGRAGIRFGVGGSYGGDGLGAMRAFQAWCEEWAAECFRVLKPGGHILAFGGSRTWHRLASAVEDAGFEIRDSIAWLYGSGFPKSMDVSKAIDKAAGAVRETVGEKVYAGGHIQRSNGTDLGALNDDGWTPTDGRTETAPATDAAKAWEGWGTALKPAFEPIVVGRKPLQGTVAGNVLAYGVGALNIDATRVQTGEDTRRNASGGDNGMIGTGTFKIRERRAEDQAERSGRWPANVVLDETQAAELDRQSGTLTSHDTTPGGQFVERNASSLYQLGHTQTKRPVGRGDSGGASRFFPTFRYEAKAPGSERPEADGVAHPTVKPLDLMRWLVRLVTPPGGTVLEPFAGSGTTAEACVLEGFGCIAIEREADYLPLIRKRIQKDHAVSLFGEDW